VTFFFNETVIPQVLQNAFSGLVKQNVSPNSPTHLVIKRFEDIEASSLDIFSKKMNKIKIKFFETQNKIQIRLKYYLKMKCKIMKTLSKSSLIVGF
jgi:hypothetical protein